jgi:hypothetical protein
MSSLPKPTSEDTLSELVKVTAAGDARRSRALWKQFKLMTTKDEREGLLRELLPTCDIAERIAAGLEIIDTAVGKLVTLRVNEPELGRVSIYGGLVTMALEHLLQELDEAAADEARAFGVKLE